MGMCSGCSRNVFAICSENLRTLPEQFPNTFRTQPYYFLIFKDLKSMQKRIYFLGRLYEVYN
jgi:hypothetical protein